MSSLRLRLLLDWLLLPRRRPVDGRQQLLLSHAKSYVRAWSSTTIGAGDRCAALQREGEGRLQLARYYYNAARRDCQTFIYRGEKGNENNFLDRETCEAECVPGECPTRGRGTLHQT